MAATELMLETGGELQVIGVRPEFVRIAASPDAVGAYGAMREAADRDTLHALEKIVDAVEPGAPAKPVFLAGDPAARFAEARREPVGVPRGGATGEGTRQLRSRLRS